MAVENVLQSFTHVSGKWQLAPGPGGKEKRFVLILLLVSGSEATGSRQCPAVAGLSFSLCTETGPLCVVFSSALCTCLLSRKNEMSD